MYITKDDYKTRISTDLLNLVISDGEENGDDVLATVSKIAEDTIDTTAGVLYDLTAEFQKTGTDRNYFIFAKALSICLYEIHQRLPDDNVPEKVIKNYNDSLTDLENTAKGKFPLKLPPPIPPTTDTTSDGTLGETTDEAAVTDGKGLRRIGSQARRTNGI